MENFTQTKYARGIVLKAKRTKGLIRQRALQAQDSSRRHRSQSNPSAKRPQALLCVT